MQINQAWCVTAGASGRKWTDWMDLRLSVTCDAFSGQMYLFRHFNLQLHASTPGAPLSVYALHATEQLPLVMLSALLLRVSIPQLHGDIQQMFYAHTFKSAARSTHASHRVLRLSCCGVLCSACIEPIARSRSC